MHFQKAQNDQKEQAIKMIKNLKMISNLNFKMIKKHLQNFYRATLLQLCCPTTSMTTESLLDYYYDLGKRAAAGMPRRPSMLAPHMNTLHTHAAPHCLHTGVDDRQQKNVTLDNSYQNHDGDQAPLYSEGLFPLPRDKSKKVPKSSKKYKKSVF